MAPQRRQRVAGRRGAHFYCRPAADPGLQSGRRAPSNVRAGQEGQIRRHHYPPGAISLARTWIASCRFLIAMTGEANRVEVTRRGFGDPLAKEHPSASRSLCRRTAISSSAPTWAPSPSSRSRASSRSSPRPAPSGREEGHAAGQFAPQGPALAPSPSRGVLDPAGDYDLQTDMGTITVSLPAGSSFDLNAPHRSGHRRQQIFPCLSRRRTNLTGLVGGGSHPALRLRSSLGHDTGGTGDNSRKIL